MKLSLDFKWEHDPNGRPKHCFTCLHQKMEEGSFCSHDPQPEEITCPIGMSVGVLSVCGYWKDALDHKPFQPGDV